MIYLDVFWVFFRISFVAFGSIFAVLPVLKHDLVSRGWITNDQFFQTFIIGQFVPGPNMAMCPLIGYRVAGWGGWLAAFLGIYGAPVLIMSASYVVYARFRHLAWVRRLEIGLRPLVIGLFTGAGVKILLEEAHPHVIAALVVAIAGSTLFAKKLVSPLLSIFLMGIAWWAYLRFLPH